MCTALALAALLAGALPAAPAAAAGGPLLSGYGGPGEGNQAILGSTLIGGPSGGAGGGSGAGTAAALSSPETPAAGASGPSAGAGRGGTRATRAHHSSGAGHPRGSNGAARATTPAYRSVAPVALASATGSQALGLSSADVVLIVVALAALLLTAALTKGLARRAR